LSRRRRGRYVTIGDHKVLRNAERGPKWPPKNRPRGPPGLQEPRSKPPLETFAPAREVRRPPPRSRSSSAATVLRLRHATEALLRRPLGRCVLPVKIGHGRGGRRASGSDQQGDSASITNMVLRATRRAIELAHASLARPRDLNRVFFTSGGSESVESAIKPCASTTSSRPPQQDED